VAEQGAFIAQLLNRDFVIQQLEDIQQQLRGDVDQKREGGPDQAAELGWSDYEAAHDQVETALQKEKSASSGQPGFVPPPPERRGRESSPPLDDFAFISREPVISIAQSALEFYFNHAESKAGAVQQEMPDDRRRSDSEVPIITDRRLPGGGARRGSGRRLLDKFSITDPAWVSSLIATGVRWLRKRHAFNPAPPEPVQIGDRARVIVVGDWGSGIPRAQRVGTAMRMAVEQGVRDTRDVHVVHLGDVYYSGWEYEYRNRFLPYWPVKAEEADKIGSWCLNGNHDMYSGGHAYFEFLLKDPRFRKQGQASFFRLYNQNWQLLGLDTAWDDNGLKDPQGNWVKQVLDQNKQKTLFLTHHQLFSAYEPDPAVGKVLGQKLAPVLNEKRIDAWFWGHEHRFIVYEPTVNVQHARLVGHGGVPVYMTHKAGAPYIKPAIYEDRRFIPRGLEHWAMFGFAILDFDGATISVSYVDETGSTVKTETI
jgi:Calcineurin-like phosphoesterase